MQNVRLRRLQADYEAMRRLVRLHPRIQLEGVSGNPPERYRLILRVLSLRERGAEVETAAEHRLEITLPLGYPRDAPLFRMLTPVFHPNIAPHAVCIGDHWSAGETLDSLIQRVAEMLAFQSYNTKSPLNGIAAAWVDQHRDRLPIDASDLFVDMAAAEAPPAAAAAPDDAAPAVATAPCSNCASRAPTRPCGRGHSLCADCAMTCATCGRSSCLACGETYCATCHPPCSNCSSRAPTRPCNVGHLLCADCTITCPKCSRLSCLTCGETSCAACALPRSSEPTASPTAPG